jgi:hypothetical protein
MAPNKEQSLWQEILKKLKIGLKKYRKFSEKFNPIFLQTVQLSFIYFFAFVDLVYSILNTVFALGYIPWIIQPIMPVIRAILDSAFLKIWASPEKVFFMSYFVIEFMIIRQSFKFSKLVRYNILLVFSLLMIQGVVISYWDVLFNRQIATTVAKWTIDQGAIVGLDKEIAIWVFFTTFIFFLFSYMCLYIKAIQGYFFTFPGLYWLTDSVSFWLKIKTPTMRFGKRKK